MTREQLLLELQQEYARRREDNLRLYQQKTDELCQRCPGLRELLDARHSAVLNGVRTGLLSPRKAPDANQSLPTAMALMNRRIAESLKAAGLPENSLQPIYTCPLCKDEGYLYTPSRQMCACLKKALNQKMLGELGLADDRQTFEAFNESIFSDEKEAAGPSQRQMAVYVKNVCEAYADRYPHTETPNLLLTGKSGLGKTYLLRAIAHRAAQRDILPAYTSAYHLLEVARKAYFDNNSDLMAGYINAPLLLLDDLGSEPLMQNITVTQLFNLFNERALKGLHTVVSTNLDIAELKERYTERIASRLMDATSWRKLALIGDDVRKRLKRS